MNIENHPPLQHVGELETELLRGLKDDQATLGQDTSRVAS